METTSHVAVVSHGRELKIELKASKYGGEEEINGHNSSGRQLERNKLSGFTRSTIQDYSLNYLEKMQPRLARFTRIKGRARW